MMLVLYTMPNCPYCKLAKAYLDVHKLPYTVAQLDEPEARQEAYDTWGLVQGQRTMPQLFVVMSATSVDRVGGYDEMVSQNVKSLFKELAS